MLDYERVKPRTKRKHLAVAFTQTLFVGVLRNEGNRRNRPGFTLF
jgi:hypothetical protein